MKSENTHIYTLQLILHLFVAYALTTECGFYSVAMQMLLNPLELPENDTEPGKT